MFSKLLVLYNPPGGPLDAGPRVLKFQFWAPRADGGCCRKGGRRRRGEAGPRGGGGDLIHAGGRRSQAGPAAGAGGAGGRTPKVCSDRVVYGGGTGGAWSALLAVGAQVLSRQGGRRCSRSVLRGQRLAELPAQVVAHLGLPGALLLVRLSLLRLRRVRCRWRRSWPNGGLRGVLGGLGTTFTMRDAA